MNDILELLENVPGGWVLAIFLLLVFGPPAILSKTAAEKFGIFGHIARWWRDRPITRIHQEGRETQAQSSVLEDRIRSLEEHIRELQIGQAEERKRWQEAAREDREAWRTALDAAEAEIESIRSGLRVRDRSLFSLYDWTNRARIEALNGGVTLPPIPEVAFPAITSRPTPEAPSGEGGYDSDHEA